MKASDHHEIPLNEIDPHVGARLRTRRQLLQMSEQCLADFLEISEIDLAEIEEGRSQVGFEALQKAAHAIGVPERYFYQGVDGEGADDPRSRKAKPSWVRDVDRWFRDHVSPHEGLFLKLAKHLTGNVDAARDLVHDAYAAVLSDERWRTVDNPKAYLRRTVTNLALDVIKRNKIVPMEQYADIELLGHVDLSPDACQSVVDRERLQTVLAALEKLPRQCRTVFVMRRIEDVPPKVIAARLGISLGTVEGHLARGMLKLNRHLENHRKGIDLKVLAARQQSGNAKLPAKKVKR